jgi:acyl-[acyl-carrier-protein]-phospholipid O-acyltransferase/long-chain-fatty-acid--[acyl-carrier-protein] ligase
VHPWIETYQTLSRLSSAPVLWRSAIGWASFWCYAAVVLMSALVYGVEVLALDALRVGSLGTVLVLGCGSGSLVAQRLSGVKGEPGLIPCGTAGLAGLTVLLAVAVPAYLWTALVLLLLGCASGWVIVPLTTCLQRYSGPEEHSSMPAVRQALGATGVLLGAGVFWSCRDVFHVPATGMLLLAGAVALLGAIYCMRRLSDFCVRFLVTRLTRSLYRIHIVGRQYMPEQGPALLICNHLSFADGFLLGSCMQRFIRFLLARPFYEARTLHWLFRSLKEIPVASWDRSDVRAALGRARQALHEGHVVCIFAEGAISRTGNLLRFQRGFEIVMKGVNAPIIPVHLDRLWGGPLSFKGGHMVWRWARLRRHPVTVSFGAPLPPTTRAATVRQAIMELGSAAVAHRRTAQDLLHLRFIRTAKRRWFAFCMADTPGRQVRYGQALVDSLWLARWLRTRCTEEAMIGILLPTSVLAALAHIAALLAGKVPVHLNDMAAQEDLVAAVQQCSIRTIVTSRPFLALARVTAQTHVLTLDEVLPQRTILRQIWCTLVAWLTPTCLLQATYTQPGQTPDSLATVVFSPGSTGTSQGVMLSHHNLLSNVESLDQVLVLAGRDRLLSTLPFYSACGLTIMLWLPLSVGFGVIYCANPAPATPFDALVQAHRATLVLSPPACYERHLQQCQATSLALLRYALTGTALPSITTAHEFKARYGRDLLAGYGCAEMASVIALNVPDVLYDGKRQTGVKPGTVGHPLPGIAVKVVHPETGVALPYGTAGLLLVRGPNRMLGYLGQPAHTAAVLRDGWYVTGDIASLDEDGFIHLSDRLPPAPPVGQASG